MNFLSNAHTHSTYCDGVSSISELLEQAQRLGFVSLGFSGHAAQGFDNDYSMSGERQRLYCAELKALQATLLEQKKAPRLWVGLEMDLMAAPQYKCDAFEHFDYVIGSTHYLCKTEEGAHTAVDGDPTTLKKYVDEVLDGDGLLMASQYYQALVEALLADKPQIIGHFDLVRKHAQRLGFFDVNSTVYRRIALQALEQARPCGGVLEINTGSIARKTMISPYPTLELLGAWHELGGEVTVTTDCHDARFLDFELEEALLLARHAGFNRVLRLGVGDALWDEVTL